MRRTTSSTDSNEERWLSSTGSLPWPRCRVALVHTGRGITVRLCAMMAFASSTIACVERRFLLSVNTSGSKCARM